MQASTMYRAVQEETTQENMRQVAISLLREGLTLEAIVRMTGLLVEQIQQLQPTSPQKPQA